MSKIKQFFIGFKEGAGIFANNIRAVVNFSLLLLVYFIGIGFTSAAAKIFGKKFLELRISGKSQTYWSNLDLKKKKIDEYYRQF